MEEVKDPTRYTEMLAHLTTAVSFYCYARTWWDGAGVDAASWWKDASGCVRHQVLITGETWIPTVPREVLNETVSSDMLDSVLGQFEKLGGGELKSQYTRSACINYDAWFGAKREGQQDPHWILIVGGFPDDPRALALQRDVLDRCPMLSVH